MIYFVAGGTGGHLYPAISCAEALQEMGRQVTLITDKRGLKFQNSNVFFRLSLIHISRKNTFFYGFTLCKSFIKCLILFFLRRPQCVVGFGGYVTIPPLLAAQILRIPTAIQEQNVFLGRANRFLSKRADKVFVAFENLKNPLNSYIVGPLVRNSIRRLIDVKYKILNPFTILIIGGSQGAKILSTVVPQAIALLPRKIPSQLYIIQQCREEYILKTKKVYEEAGIEHEISPFFQDMASLYEKACLVIARAGASTVAELTFSSRPALVIPFAQSIEGDQYQNALMLKEKKACWLLEEKNVTLEKMAQIIENLYRDPQKLMEVSHNIRSLCIPKASENMAQKVIELTKNN